ncbi:MFS transporter [Streptomyces sp. NPDC006333]|uniref:MFS transporter n=1 Tax=Streptomyces sp. NPDC006333 TaxID=3156753 RepID=UPI0033AF4BA3
MTELIGDGLPPGGRLSGEVQGPPDDGHRAAGSAALLTAMCLGLLLSMFNATVVNVMLPTMRGALHVSETGLQWVAALFTLCNAALLLAGGALGELIGKRMTFLSGVAVFTVGSAACAAAPTLGVLLAARTVQAIGVAVMTPQTLSILVTEYTDRTRRARAVGIWAGMASLGLAAGPVVGGVVIDVGSWRGGFMVSAALGAVTLVLGFRVISRARYGRPVQAPRPDFAGAALSVLALASLVFGLIESATLGWTSPFIVGAFALAASATAAFILTQRAASRRGRSPLMPLELWRSRGFVGANTAGLAYFFALFGILYFCSVYLQQYRGFSTLEAGLTFLPMTIVMASVGPVSGRLSARFTTTSLTVAGLLVAATGSMSLALLAAGGVVGVVCSLAVFGLGAGLMSSPMSNMAVSSAAARHSGAASATHNAFRQIGSTLGVAALGTLVAAGHHAAGDTKAAFSTGLSHGMVAVAVVLVVCAIAVAVLGRRRYGATPEALRWERRR